MAFFIFFENFWMTKLKPFLGKTRKSIQNWLNWELVIGSILENVFEAALRSRMNVLSLWNWYFQFLANFWVTNLKPFFCESEAKRLKLCKFKLNHRKGFIKCLLSYLELKKEYSEPLNLTFFRFFANFWVTKLKPFIG